MNNIGHNPPTLQQRVATLEDRLESLLKQQEADLVGRVEKLEGDIFMTKPYFTLEEAAQFLGISRALLYKLTSKMMIPHFKPRGKMVYFDKEELIAWIRHGNITVISRPITLEEIRNMCNGIK